MYCLRSHTSIYYADSMRIGLPCPASWQKDVAPCLLPRSMLLASVRTSAGFLSVVCCPSRPSFRASALLRSQRVLREFHVSARYSQDAVKPPYKILYAGSDRFSCIPFQHLMNAPGATACFEIALILTKVEADLIDEIHVLVSPDKRTSRGLKQIYRRMLCSFAFIKNLS